MKVFIVSTYGEYGAENVQATTDVDKVNSLIESMGVKDTTVETAKAKTLLAAYASGDLTADGTPHDLSDGWGGLQLHIVELIT